MRSSFRLAVALATAAVSISALTMPAFAECKRFGFLVNDYGKDGPTKDAKELLDKMIAGKMAERGVKDYKTGAKSVKCELFLNFVVFDEHTCTAEATVCWGGSDLPKSQQAKAEETGDETAKPTAHEKHSKKSKDEVAKASDDTSSDAKSDETSKYDDMSKSDAKSKSEETSKTAKVEEKSDSAGKKAEKEAETAKAEEPKADEPKSQNKEEPKPEHKKKNASASKSHASPDGVADPVKPRIASVSQSSASSADPSAVVTGSVDAGKKKEPAKTEKKKSAEKSSESDGGYPTPLGPAPGQ